MNTFCKKANVWESLRKLAEDRNHHNIQKLDSKMCGKETLLETYFKAIYAVLMSSL